MKSISNVPIKFMVRENYMSLIFFTPTEWPPAFLEWVMWFLWSRKLKKISIK